MGKKREIRTTFDTDFIQLMKTEAVKRDLFMNELIEKAVQEYIKNNKPSSKKK